MDGRSPERGCNAMRIIEYHDFKTLLGPCFISFSLPLLVPGVVLTVVGSYGNDNWLPAFGGWHLAGIVILSIAVLLLISGIVLKCFYRPIISADIEQHLSPRHSMISGNKNLGYEDEDDVLVISSTGSKLNNKVSPGHKNQVAVSTHEKRDKSIDGSKPRKQTESTNAESRSNEKNHIVVQPVNSKTTSGSSKVHKPRENDAQRQQQSDNSAESTENQRSSGKPDLATSIQSANGRKITTTVTTTVTTETRDNPSECGDSSV